MRETLLDLMIRFNEGNMLDPWNENEEELDDLDDLLGSYRRGTLGSYQTGTTGNVVPPVDPTTPAGGTAPAPAAAPAVPFTPPAGYSTNPSEVEGFFQGLSKGQTGTYGQQGFQPSWGTGGFGTLQSWEQQDAPTGFDPGVMGTTPGGTPYYSYSKTRPGAAGGAAGGGASGGGSPEDIAGRLAGYGEGFMQPGSDYSKRWMEQMREEVGKGTDAAQRAAGYQAAQSGFGGGVSPELLQMQGDIGVAGQEAAGDAASDYLLRAPEMGIGAMTGALGPLTSMRGQDLTSKTSAAGDKLTRDLAQLGDKRAQRVLDKEDEWRDEERDWQREQWEQDQGFEEFAGSTLPGGGNVSPPNVSGGWSLGIA